MAELPKAVRFLNFRGRADVEIGQEFGPNTFGEYLYAVEVTRDAEADRTRVGLSYIKPAVQA